MDVKLQSNSLHSFDLIRQAAKEYNDTEYKFYNSGFIKYRIEHNVSIFIDDIYIIPEHRGSIAASLVLEGFTKFLNDSGILFLYGFVMKNSDKYDKRISTFNKWGLKVTNEYPTHSIVSCLVKDLKGKR